MYPAWIPLNTSNAFCTFLVHLTVDEPYRF